MPAPHQFQGEPVHATTRTPAVRRVLAVILVLNAVVVAAKITTGVRTGALTVLGAALESGLDMLNNVIGMLLVTVAGQEPDEEHPYGHEKFETLGALGIVVFLSISCFELLRQGAIAILGRAAPERISAIDVGILIATLAINFVVVRYERRRGRQLSSPLLLADAEHTRSDILVTLLAIGSLALSRIGLTWIDGWLALAVATIIAWSGYQILRGSIPVLVDQRAIPAADLRTVVERIPDIIEVRTVRSRSTASGHLFAELTIVVSPTMSVEAAHALADAVEDSIGDEFGASEVTVHVEPS